MRKGFLIYEEMRKFSPYMRRPLVIYMTLHPIPLNFLIYEENVILFLSVYLPRHLYLPHHLYHNNNFNYRGSAANNSVRVPYCKNCLFLANTERNGTTFLKRKPNVQTFNKPRLPRSETSTEHLLRSLGYDSLLTLNLPQYMRAGRRFVQVAER